MQNLLPTATVLSSPWINPGASRTLSDLIADEADGPWPDVIDRCPCPDCGTPLLWTRLDDVRTAWQVHHCPPREETTP